MIREKKKISHDEMAFYCILTDPAAIDYIEFCWVDFEKDDNCFRAHAFQWSWWRCRESLQIDLCSRDVGKSLGIAARSSNFCFRRPQQERALVAPELNHLNLLSSVLETRLQFSWMTRQMMRPGNKAITHRPLEIFYKNGSRIEGRIPQRTGAGFKGLHSVELEADEGQDIVEAGWKELTETVKRGIPGFKYLIHGVTRGVNDTFYKFTQPGSGFFVHRIVAMHKPTWTDEERQQKIKEYGGPDSPDFKRNVYGMHGDEQSPIFPQGSLFNCHPYDTLVWTQSKEGIVPMSIESIKEGDEVVNVIGKGIVKRVTVSEQSELVRIGIGGEDFFPTPEHPYFTSKGWVKAKEIRPGDQVLSFQEVRDMWNSFDETKSEEVLFSKMLGQSGSGCTKKLFGLSERVLGIESKEMLQSNVCGDFETTEKSSACTNVPVLRERDSSRERYFSILQLRMQMFGDTACSCSDCLSRLWESVHRRRAQKILLSSLFFEMAWGDLSGLGYSEKDVEALRFLRSRILQTFEREEVLFSNLCESGFSRKTSTSGYKMPSVSNLFSSQETAEQMVFKGMLVQVQDDSKTTKKRDAHDAQRQGWSPFGTVSTLASVGRTGGRMATPILDESPGGRGGCCVDASRHCSSSVSDSYRSGWDKSQVSTRERFIERRLALKGRVESVEVLKRGDKEFDSRCGEKDTVTCYDLTVSGHPSFAIGKHGIIVHNCIDDDELSLYNVNIYKHLTIVGEDVGKEENAILNYLDFPASHLDGTYERFWAGADIGFTRDPTEILVFGEYKPKTRDENSRLRLLLRLSMKRMKTPYQAEAIRWLISQYRPVVFGLDSTGAGQPLNSELQVWYEREQSENPSLAAETKRALDTIKGYNFSSKIPVSINQKAAADGIGTTEEVIERPFKQAATDMLRVLIDNRRLELPWDTELMDQFRGQTYSVQKIGIDSYGNRTYSVGGFHILDAARCAAVGFSNFKLEKMLQVREQEPVQQPVYLSFIG